MPRPKSTEAAPYYFGYIDRVLADDVVGELQRQAEELQALLLGISEEKSLSRYAPSKWSVRELWNHVNDTERVFVFRAFWFARGFDSPLPSFDQDIAVRHGAADAWSWANHVDEFLAIRRSTLAFFRGLSAEAWDRTGVASGNTFSVRALAYIAAGHALHHVAVLKEKYL